MWWSIILQLVLKVGVPAVVEWLSGRFPNAKWLQKIAEILGIFATSMKEAPENKAQHVKEATAELKKVKLRDSATPAPWNTKGIE